MTLFVCPGIHDPGYTQEFLNGLGRSPADCLVLPTKDYPPVSAAHILRFLIDRQGCPSRSGSEPLLIVAFSAGVVGAIGAAWLWQAIGGEIRAFIALDGWGVPLSGDFPIYRLSHDYFTHWSSAWLGNGVESFYAAPAVEHLSLWRSPKQALGYSSRDQERSTNAASFLKKLLQQYGEDGLLD